MIIGTPSSGKSQLAEDIVVRLAQDRRKIYLATMIAFDEEGKERIKKHRRLRQGKGFETIECPENLSSLKFGSDDLDHNEVVINDNCVLLLECMSNLVGNELYSPRNKGLDDEELVTLIVSETIGVANKVADIVIVSNEFKLDDTGYDDETRRYVRLLHDVNEVLKKEMDEVIVK